MRVIWLLIFAFIVKGDSDESKYIDLLPDDEKEVFIQKVARRINKSVQTKEVSNKSSVEIPDDELKAHEEFIKKILKEESSNMRKNILEKETESPEDVRVKSIENLKELGRAGHIDFTVRTERQKRGDDRKSSEISAEVVTKNVIVKTKNFGSEDKTKQSDETREDIQVRHVKKPVIENVKIKTSNFGTEYREAAITTNVKNNDTEYAHLSEETHVMDVKRGAIKSDTITETVDTDEIQSNNSNINNSEMSISKEYQPTIMDDFTAEKVQSSLEMTDKHETDTIETSSLESTHQVTSVNEKTEGKGNQSKENNKLTQAIYNSELESDSDSSNETVTDKASDLSKSSETVNKTNKLISTNNIEETTAKSYLRGHDNDIVTDASEVNNLGNSIKTTENSSKTVTDQIVHNIVQSSTNYQDSTDKIMTDENKSKSVKFGIPPYIINDRDGADEVPSKTGNFNSDIAVETVKGSRDMTTVPSDVSNITVTTDIIVNSISESPTEITAPTNIVPATIAYATENNNDITNEGLKAIHNIARTGINFVNETSEESSEDLIQAENENERKNKMDIPSLTEDKNELKDTKVIAISESIMTTINTQNANEYTTNAPLIKKITPNHDKPSPISDQALDMLRNMLLLVKDDKKIETDTFKGLQTEYNRQIHNKNKEHEVYEIPADKPPFVKGPAAITEHPYYVPVYNYSPNKAYFNTHNRLGPNEDDDKEIKYQLLEADEKEQGNDAHASYEDLFGKLKDRPNYGNDYNTDDEEAQRKKISSQGYTKFTDKMSHPIKWSQILRQSAFKDRICNPNDDVDINYDHRIGVNTVKCRKNKTNIFPSTHKESRPGMSMDIHMKDNLSAARQLLYEKKYFGFPYKTTKNEIKTTENPQVTIHSKYYRNGDRSAGIALDYYFGRMKAEIDEVRPPYKKVGYINSRSKTRDMYITNDVLNDDLVKYINLIKYKGDTYINNEYSATSHTDLIDYKKRRIINKQEESKINKGADKMKIISMKVENDVSNTLETLQDINTTLNNQEDNLNVYLSVLKDMIHSDNNALKQYDWLGTTVDLQSAFEKLLGLIDGIQNSEELHPSDFELLKYVIFLHKFSQELDESKLYADKLRKKQVLPRNKNKKKSTDKSLLNRVWLYLRKKQINHDEDSNLDNLNKFLMKLQDGLYDLHEAIKNIAKITTYKKQNWFKNLKQLYLTDDASYLSLLLHISTTRLFGLIEDSAKNNLERDFKSFVHNNKKEAMKTVDEMVFVFKILDDVKG